MNLLDPISSIMTSNVISLQPNSSIAEAAEIFKQKRINHIPIVDNDQLLGIVSKSDYLFFRRGFLNDKNDERIEEIRISNYEVQDIMTQGIATIEPTEKINVALEIFKENLFHAIPIVENGKLKGIVTTFDIIFNLAESNGAVAEYTIKK
jgi:acetoin utilization protein AcuB